MSSSSNQGPCKSGDYESGLELPPPPDEAVVTERRFCNCPQTRWGRQISVLKVSTRPWSEGRVFFSCKNYVNKANPGCGFFMWLVDLRRVPRLNGEGRTDEQVLKSIERKLNHLSTSMTAVQESVTSMERSGMDKLKSSSSTTALVAVAAAAVLFFIVHNLGLTN